MEEIVISWSTLLKAIFGWLSVYFLMPAIMLLREMLILFVIDKFIANEDMRMDIERWATSHNALENYYGENEGLRVTHERVIYRIGANEVTKSVYDDYHFMRSKHRQIHNELYPVIMSKQRLISKLTKHFKIGDYKPITEEMEHVLARNSANEQ